MVVPDDKGLASPTACSGAALMTCRRVGEDDASMRPRILIVDDHVGFRTVARAMLQSEGFEVVGEAADGGDALAAVARLRPEIVLLDIHLPDMDGFEVSHRLAGLPSPPVVVLISSRPIADLRRQVADSPVAGFIAKHELSAAAVAALAG
jgi:CheY-like chemotaxis protein